jgi:hypothetical protein
MPGGVMKTRFIYAVPLGVVLTAGVFLAGRTVGLAQQPTQPTDSLMVIEEFEIPAGVTASAAIEESSQSIRVLRKTGDFKSARLFMHSWGPKFALYVILEPNSWQALKTGSDKLFAARPETRAAPFKWASHSDNIVTEVPVK